MMESGKYDLSSIAIDNHSVIQFFFFFFFGKSKLCQKRTFFFIPKGGSVKQGTPTSRTFNSFTFNNIIVTLKSIGEVIHQVNSE